MELQIDHAIEILGRTPNTLSALLRDLPAEWTTQNEGGDSWSPFDVVGHLIHGEETDWIPRLNIILSEGEERTFAPFDRNAQFRKSEGKSVTELLETFHRLRTRSVEQLKALNLNSEQLEKTGNHPEFGRVTLKQLLATWVVHDLSHLAQITRVMCKQYADEVGPWRTYLPILDR